MWHAQHFIHTTHLMYAAVLYGECCCYVTIFLVFRIREFTRPCPSPTASQWGVEIDPHSDILTSKPHSPWLGGATCSWKVKVRVLHLGVKTSWHPGPQMCFEMCLSRAGHSALWVWERWAGGWLPGTGSGGEPEGSVSSAQSWTTSMASSLPCASRAWSRTGFQERTTNAQQWGIHWALFPNYALALFQFSP